MRHEVAIRRIESFGKRFGPSRSHLYLAYHAAFPLALTPDLLYRIWANFQRDVDRKLLNIPWIAVADLLLSNLCDDVGHELYEMDVAVRNELLKRLKEDPRFGEKRINELSNFLLAYVRKDLNSSEPDKRDFAQSQRWTALAYKDSEEAARELALAFNEAYQQDRAELVRLATLTETLAQPLQECEKLLIYARAMGHYARKRLEDAKNQVSGLPIKGRLVSISGVDLPIPLELIANAEVEKEQNSVPINSPLNRALMRPEGNNVKIAEDLEKHNKKLNYRKQQKGKQYWLFQGNPKYYRILDSIRDFEQMYWLVTRYAEDIAVGDGVLIWSAGKKAGIYAISEVIEPVNILNEVPDKDYWIVNKMSQPGGKRVLIHFTTKLLEKPLLYEELIQDAILKKLSVIFDASGTNFQVTPEQWMQVYKSRKLDIEYSKLRNLLEAGKWKKADKQTAKLMFNIAKREKQKWLRVQDIENFSYTDLQTIDQLWVKHSNGHFGFSVQKKIWQELGEKVNIETERKLGERLGWFDSDEWWLDYSDFTFSLDAPEGHLPANWDCEGIDGEEAASTCLLLSRLLGYNAQGKTNILPSQFQSLIAEKVKGFVGREYVFEAINAFITNHTKGYFTIIGYPGVGKSAILAKYVQDTGCLAYFNVLSQRRNRVDQFLESVCCQLIERYQLSYDPLPPNAKQDGQFLSRLLGEAAQKRKGEAVIIAVDALDEVDQNSYLDSANILYLPAVLPNGVYFILTERTGIEIHLTSFAPMQTLDLSDFQIGIEQDMRIYINNWVNRSDRLRRYIDERGITIKEFTDKIVRKSESNFMYLRYVLPDIESGLYQDLTWEQLPEGIEQYYETHWHRMGMNANNLSVEGIRILYLLCEVREPISRRKICTISGEDEYTVQTILNTWQQFLLEEIRDNEKCYIVYHHSFRDFLARKELPLTSRINISIDQQQGKNSQP